MMNVSVRMEDDTKKKFEKFCKDVGLSISAAFNIYAKRVIREHKIPFDISNEDPFYSAENQERLARSINHAKEGKLTEHELIETQWHEKNMD